MIIRFEWMLAAAILALVALLWRANVPKRVRHRQLWSPLAALAFGLSAAVTLQQLLVRLPAWILRLPAAIGGWLLPSGVPATRVLLLINVLLLAIFAVVKIVVNGATRLPGDRGQTASGRGLLVHRRLQEGQLVLREEWVFGGRMFRSSAVLLGVTVIAAVLVSSPSQATPWAYALPAVPLLALLEIGWYLDGERADEQSDDLSGDAVQATRVEDFEALYREYLARWGDRVLATATLGSETHHAIPVGAQVGIEAGPEEATADEQWRTLLAGGAQLAWSDRHLLRDLAAGEDLLIREPIADRLGPVLATLLHARLKEGQRVLVLVDTDRLGSPARLEAVAEWLASALGLVAGSRQLWVVRTFGEFRERGRSETCNVLVGSTHDVLTSGPARERWYDDLGAVVVLNATGTLMAHLPSARALIRILLDREPRPQLVLVSDGRLHLESGLRDVLGGDLREHTMSVARHATVYAIAWRLEGSEQFQEKLVGEQTFLGAEPVLAVPAWQRGIGPIVPLGQEEQPWDEYAEELAKLQLLRTRGFRREMLGSTPVSWLVGSRNRGVLLIRDRDYNLVAALREYMGTLRDVGILHVVSPPYLLRNYFADNLDYFMRVAEWPRALVPRIADASPYAVAYTLLERLVNRALPEAEVTAALSAIKEVTAYPEVGLPDLLQRALGDAFASHTRESVSWRLGGKESGSPNLEEVVSFGIDHNARNTVLPWLQQVAFVDAGGHSQGAIVSDHVDQHFLPGQLHSLRSRGDGGFVDKPYKVLAVDRSTARIRTEHSPAVEVTGYRAFRSVSISEIGSLVAEVGAQQVGRWTVTAQHFTASFAVETEGYFTFPGAVSRTVGAYEYVAFERGRIPVRRYPSGRLLAITLRPPTPLEANASRSVSRTLAVLLSELMPTLFPETHRLLLVGTNPADDSAGHGTAWAHVLSHLTITSGATEKLSAAGALQLIFLEDSVADMGLTQGIMTEWRSILELLQDYLTWVTGAEQSRTQAAWHRPDGIALDRNEFLRYGGSDVPAWLDLTATASAIDEIVGAGGTLRRDRARFDAGTHPTLAGQGMGGDRYCDFCGRALTGAFERTSDGRERCDLCRQTAIDTPSQLVKSYKEARRFLQKELGVRDLKRGITVRFATASEIAAARGRVFIPTSGVDPRAVGLAIHDGGSSFSILIEAGAPYRMCIDTIVHELTHIWQFSRLDHARMRRDHGLLLIEGHATWAGLTWLERSGLDPELALLCRGRMDEYGEGLRLVERMMGEAGVGNAFVMLRGKYGRE